ncbi:lactose phosphotransferase system repressor [Arthrobacter sp. Hiyo4]|nr:lactose phosphotransferase system repressor [Arthrobacter sp. Hiyo4]
MTRTDRLTAILDILAKTGQVEVEEIVSQLAVSPATARRDLDSLAKRRLLTRTRGGPPPAPWPTTSPGGTTVTTTPKPRSRSPRPPRR